MSNLHDKERIADIPVSASLSPHPLDEDSDMEPDWLAWIPGFDESKDPESGEHPLFKDENLQVYRKVEDLAVSHFRKGFAVVAPLFKEYHFNSIHIACDSIGLLAGEGNALAAFDYARSRTLAGDYVFHLYASLIIKYVKADRMEYELDAHDNDVWVHELIHLLDNHNILSASIYRSSDSPAENFKSWLLKFREEGIANLNWMLSGNGEISTMQEALDQFKQHLAEAERLIEGVSKTDDKFRQNLFKGYFYYTVGPWVVMEVMRNQFQAWEIDYLEESIARAERKEPVDQEIIREILKLSFLITPTIFLEEINRWRSKAV